MSNNMQIVIYDPPALLPPEEIEMLKKKKLIDPDWEELCGGRHAPPFYLVFNGTPKLFESPHRPFKKERRPHDLGPEYDRKGHLTGRSMTGYHTAWVPDDSEAARKNFRPRNAVALTPKQAKALRSGKYQPFVRYLKFLGDEAKRLNDYVGQQQAELDNELQKMRAAHQARLAEAERQLQEELNAKASEIEVERMRIAAEGGLTLKQLEELVKSKKTLEEEGADVNAQAKKAQKKQQKQQGGAEA